MHHSRWYHPQQQKGKHDNFKKVDSVIQSLRRLENKSKLLSDTRIFVREGQLVETNEDGMKKQYYMFLFSDLLIWSKQKKGGIFNYKKMMYLDMVDIQVGLVGKIEVYGHVR